MIGRDDSEEAMEENRPDNPDTDDETETDSANNETPPEHPLNLPMEKYRNPQNQYGPSNNIFINNIYNTMHIYPTVIMVINQNDYIFQ